jgi:hypothetical protein
MPALVAFVRAEEEFLIWATVLLVAYQMLTGRINTSGLLDDKLTGRRFSPERLQLLIITVGGALFYLVQVIHSSGSLPPLPHELLLVLGGSNALYLGAKTASMFSLSRTAPDAETQTKGE